MRGICNFSTVPFHFPDNSCGCFFRANAWPVDRCFNRSPSENFSIRSRAGCSQERGILHYVIFTQYPTTNGTQGGYEGCRMHPVHNTDFLWSRLGNKTTIWCPPSCVRSCSPHLHPFTYNVGKTVPQTNPQITIFIGGVFTIPSHGWFMALFCPHYLHLP